MVSGRRSHRAMEDNRIAKAAPNSPPSLLVDKKTIGKKKKNGGDTTANLARAILNNLNIFGKYISLVIFRT